MSPGLKALARQSIYSITTASVRSIVPLRQAYLDFNMERQRKSKWCWAATSVSVSRFYDPGSSWTQCHVANKALNGRLGLCCVAGFICNRDHYLDKSLSITGNFNFKSPPLDLSKVEEELEQGRVIGARVMWHNDGRGHFMAIHGYEVQDKMAILHIDDPIYKKTSMAFEVFLYNYLARGSWTHSYLTQP